MLSWHCIFSSLLHNHLKQTLTNELNNQVQANTVLDVVVGASPTGSINNTRKINDELCLNRYYYPFISAISMIAPSPDWFSGLYNLGLVKRGRWYDKLSGYRTG
jgi:hypothetical protein